MMKAPFSRLSMAVIVGGIGGYYAASQFFPSTEFSNLTLEFHASLISSLLAIIYAIEIRTRKTTDSSFSTKDFLIDLLVPHADGEFIKNDLDELIPEWLEKYGPFFGRLIIGSQVFMTIWNVYKSPVIELLAKIFRVGPPDNG